MVAKLKGGIDLNHDYMADNYFDVHPLVAERNLLQRETEGNWPLEVEKDLLGFIKCNDHDECDLENMELCVEFNVVGTLDEIFYDYEWKTCLNFEDSRCDLDGDA